MHLVIHAGDCKAGSTAIQSVLQAGSYRVAGPSIHYPQAGRRGRLNHHALADALHLPGAARWRDRAWGRLGAELRDRADGIALISSERFEFAPPEALASALDAHLPEHRAGLRVIVYVRPHAERVLSGYAQNVKQGLFLGELEDFADWAVARGRLIYARRLARWRAVFGAALTVRPMIRSALAGGSVVEDLLRIATGSESVDVLEVPRANRAPDLATLEALRLLWREVAAEGPAAARKAARLRGFIATLDAGEGQGRPCLSLSPALAARLPELFAADCADCDRTVFGRPVLGPALDAARARARESGGGARPSDPEVQRDAQCILETCRAWLRAPVAAGSAGAVATLGTLPPAGRGPLDGLPPEAG